MNSRPLKSQAKVIFWMFKKDASVNHLSLVAPKNEVCALSILGTVVMSPGFCQR
jgi:hypothetical protein